MNLWIEEILKETTHTFTFDYYDETDQMANDFHHNKLDFVIGNGVEFVKYFDKEKLADGFTGGMVNRSDEYLVLVVPTDTTIESLQKLDNPIISIAKNDEIAKLYAKNIFYKEFKKEDFIFLETNKRNDTLLKLFFKKADATITTLKTFNFAKELNPQIGEKLKIILSSNLLAGSFGYFRKGYDSKLRDEISDLAFKLTSTQRGRQIITIFQAEELVKVKVADLLPIEKMHKEYINLKKDKL